MEEVCSCGAKFAIADVGQWSVEALLEAFQTWRENHLHEFPPESGMAPEPPTIVESMSQNERALPFGFTREMEGDLA